MKMAFLPGQLFLEKDGHSFVVREGTTERIRTPSETVALAEFKKRRLALESEHPAAPVVVDKAVLAKEIGEALVDANHYEPQKFKKGRRSSRTFR